MPGGTTFPGQFFSGGSDESLRAFLDRRERELTAQIAALRGQIAPKEAELFEVQRAKHALGPPPPTAGLGDALRAIAAHAELHAGLGISATAEVTTATPSPQSSGPNASKPSAKPVGRMKVTGEMSPAFRALFERMTIKQLVVQALTDHFTSGTTQARLREFIRDAYGRDIASGSLSPQLARLIDEGVLMRMDGKYVLVGTEIIRTEESETVYIQTADDRGDNDEPI
jgi:hypothetical protein